MKKPTKKEKEERRQGKGIRRGWGRGPEGMGKGERRKGKQGKGGMYQLHICKCLKSSFMSNCT